MTHIVAVLYDETEVAGESQAYDTLDEALEVARDIAGEILTHTEHLHVMPHLAVFEYAEPNPVWEWSAPSIG